MHTLKSAIISLLISSVILTTNTLLAEDFKTIDGKEYKNVTVSRLEPDGIMLTSSSGISKVYFTELPKEIQERFHYDPAKAAAYTSQKTANQKEFQKQQEELQRKLADQNNRYWIDRGKQVASQQDSADVHAQSDVHVFYATYGVGGQQRDVTQRLIGLMQHSIRNMRVGPELFGLPSDSTPNNILFVVFQAHNSPVELQVKLRDGEALSFANGVTANTTPSIERQRQGLADHLRHLESQRQLHPNDEQLDTAINASRRKLNLMGGEVPGGN